MGQRGLLAEDARWFAYQMAVAGPGPGDDAEEDTEADQRSALDSEKSTSHVLVVDDHLDTCYALTRLLDRNGYRVECVHTGYAAIASMRKRSPSLVILDQMMPGMSGTEVLRAMRGSDQLRHVPVLVFSGIASSDEALKAGATEFLSKPTAFDKILTRVKAYIG